MNVRVAVSSWTYHNYWSIIDALNVVTIIYNVLYFLLLFNFWQTIQFWICKGNVERNGVHCPQLEQCSSYETTNRYLNSVKQILYFIC